MKYFLDTEFIEGFHKPLFGKRRHFIDLISIGLYREDGNGYYAISRDFRERDAGQWVKKNVLPQLYPKWGTGGDFWKSNDEIRKALLSYFGCRRSGPVSLPRNPTLGEVIKSSDDRKWHAPLGIEIYAYYADYDWVLFCSLFGTMLNLPEGFPMYCIDLKQMLDDKVKRLCDPVDDFSRALKRVKAHPRYPAQDGEHHARKDAEWNFKLYKFIENLHSIS